MIRTTLIGLALVCACDGQVSRGSVEGDVADDGNDGNDDDGSAPPPSLGDCEIFPADNPWNLDVSGLAVHERSDAFIDAIGREVGLHPDFGTEYEGAPNGIPYMVVGSGQAGVNVEFEEPDESDPGPYPIPADPLIEGGPDGEGDRHILMIDAEACKLYELYLAYPAGDGWTAYSGAIFDLASNALRPDRFTSADAAGLPIFPGLVRYDEVVEAREIRHALRFTVSSSQRGYIPPATHAASESTDPDLPPMGLRVRMKADHDCSGYSAEVQVICTALKKYGMLVADNGSDWYVSGVPDERWSDDNLRDLGNITGDAFEVVDTGAVIPW